MPGRNEFKVRQPVIKIIDKYKQVYAILKKTIVKLADPNGFIEIFNLKLFFSDLKNYYQSIDNLAYIINESEKVVASSILPNKIHINDFSKIMKSEMFYSIYDALLKTINSNSKIANQKLSKNSNSYRNNDLK